MLGIAPLLGKSCFLFLKVATVRKQKRAKFRGGGSAYHLAAKAIAHERGNVAGMIEMRVGQQDRVDRFGRHRKCRAIAIAQLLVSLKEAAIDEDTASIRFEQVP